MSNNYINYSEVLGPLTNEEAEWLNDLVRCINTITGQDYPEADPHFALDGNPRTPVARKAVQIAEKKMFEGATVTCEIQNNEDDKTCMTHPKQAWWFSEEGDDPALVGEVVQQFFLKWRKNEVPAPVFTLQWANWCDKMRVGEFGGGALVVTPTEVHVATTGDFVEECLQKVTRAT